MSDMQVAAQWQSLVSVDGIEGYFATKSGGDTSGDTKKVYDGGAKNPDVMGGRPTTDDITVGRPFKPGRDRPVINRLRPLVNRWRTTVTVQDVDTDLIPVGKPTVYPNALLTAVNDPEVDADSEDEQRLELTFAVGSVA